MILNPEINNHNATSLLEYLKTLDVFLQNHIFTEIVMNKPHEVITQSHEGWTYHDMPLVDYDYCFNLAKLIASYSKQKLDAQSPILSATLPLGQRVQIVIPPATKQRHMSITIRQHSNTQITLHDYEQQGFFKHCTNFKQGLTDNDQKLIDLKQQGRIREFLELAVISKKNIIISGSTGSGKTTFLKSLLRSVPSEERLISIENVDELRLSQTHNNTVSLFYTAGGQGISPLTQKELLESSLRMKPDRIFLSELIRGSEAFYFLRNVNSGHPGSMTTMHANSPQMAIEQLVLFLKEAGTGFNRQEAKDLILMCVDIIIQIHNVHGKRIITEIYYDPHQKHPILS
jgi:type IV secretion system protein VirB11